MRRLPAAILLIGFAFGTAPALGAAEAVVVDLQTRPGVTQRYLAMSPEGPAKAAVILFAGGNGLLNISGPSSENWMLRGNFLVRTRDMFRSHGLFVAVIDAPSDRKGGEGLGGFRISTEHAEDIAAVIADVRKRSANAPVWLIGTSRGTISAVNGAARLQPPRGADGLVLTSTLTGKAPGKNAKPAVAEYVYDLDLDAIRVPTLLVYHREDTCYRTLPSDVPELQRKLKNAQRTKVIAIEGGDPPRSEPCEAFAAHGYLGREADTVRAIAAWITGAAG